MFASENLKELLVAFSFPYQTPRLVRKNLHRIFNYLSIAANPKQKRSAIEAPIALALECVARKAVEIGSQVSLLLLTGVHPTLELTAATLVREGKSLGIEITAFAAIDPADIEGSLRHFGGNPRQASLFHAGIADPAEEVAGELRRSNGPCEVIDMGLHAVAIGAIRYGGLLNKNLWLGNPINEPRRSTLESAPGGSGRAGHERGRGILVLEAASSVGGMARMVAKAADPQRAGHLARRKPRRDRAACGVPRILEFAARRWPLPGGLVRRLASPRWRRSSARPRTRESWDLQVWMGLISGHWISMSFPKSWTIVSRSDGTEQPIP